MKKLLLYYVTPLFGVTVAHFLETYNQVRRCFEDKLIYCTTDMAKLRRGQRTYFCSPWIFLLFGKTLHRPNLCPNLFRISTKNDKIGYIEAYKKNSASQILNLFGTIICGLSWNLYLKFDPPKKMSGLFYYSCITWI